MAIVNCRRIDIAHNSKMSPTVHLVAGVGKGAGASKTKLTFNGPFCVCYPQVVEDKGSVHTPFLTTCNVGTPFYLSAP